MAVESPPWALQAGSYPAEQTRRAVFMWAARTAANTPGIVAGGLASTADCQVTAPGSGLSVNVSTGEMLIPGNEGGTQGPAYARVSSTTNAVVSTANPTNPRIDRIVALMSDAGYTEPTGGSGSQWAISVVTGTATSGASLANLTGAAAVPGSSLLLANLLVPATAANIITADIANVAGVVPMQNGLAVPHTVMTSQTRVLGTSYQPNTLRPTFVVVTFALNATSTAEYAAQVLMDSANPPTTVIGTAAQTAGTSAIVGSAAVTFLVPPGFFYKFVASVGSPTVTSTFEFTL